MQKAYKKWMACNLSRMTASAARGGKNNKWQQCTWRPAGNHAAFACIFSSYSWHPHPLSLVNEIRQPPLRLPEVHVQLKSTDIIFNKARMLMRFSRPHLCEHPVSRLALPLTS